MSILSAPSTLFLNRNAQSFFSSQSAFQKPRLFNNHSLISQPCQKLPISSNFESPLTKRSNPTKLALTSEDFEFIFCEPAKKTKLNQEQSNMMSFSKTKENPLRSSQLTMDQVFNTPTMSQKLHKSSVFEEISEGGSSLSFISSCTSLDELEVMEEKTIEEEKDCEVMEIVSKRKNTKATETLAESLVMKDEVISRFNLQGQENFNSNSLMTNQMIFPYEQYMTNQSYDLMNNLKVQNQFISHYPQFDINAYKSSPINWNGLLDKAAEQQFDAQLKEYKAKMGLGEEEGYDSDSNGTRSTCVEQSLGDDNKSQKAASPLYSDLYEEEKPEQKSQKKEVKQKKQRKEKKEKSNKGKEKKGRSANLQMDTQPSHLKVERGINALQVLGCQQTGIEEESDLLKKFIDVDTLQVNRNISSASTDVQSTISEDSFNNAICPSLLATIPALGSESMRRRKPVLVPVWTPEITQEDKVEEFLQKLAEIIESPVTNQEKALKVLKTFNMDMSVALEAVEENTPAYKELFRVKPRRQRRRVIG